MLIYATCPKCGKNDFIVVNDEDFSFICVSCGTKSNAEDLGLETGNDNVSIERDLLKAAVNALNACPNHKIHDDNYKDSYAVASAIDKYFREKTDNS